eukprot:6122677-Prymnesium_polylepis.1
MDKAIAHNRRRLEVLSPPSLPSDWRARSRFSGCRRPKTDARETEFRQVVHPFCYGPTMLGGP